MINQAGLGRRALLQRAMVLAGVAAFPGGPAALAAAAKGNIRQLDAARYATLVDLVDTILPKTSTPGAVEAGVPAIVDALFGTWASPSRKAELIAAIDKIEDLARQRHQRGFAALSLTERSAVLAPHDAAALQRAPAAPPPAIRVGAAPTTVDPNYSRPKQEAPQTPSIMQGPRFADPGYAKLKELIVVVFYSTQQALTHDLAYEHAPGEWRPSTPITPSTRPWGGAGNV